MAFGNLFRGVEPPKKNNEIPLEQVLVMRKQGFSNNQIIQSLQRDGFTSSQVFEALNQADVKLGADTGDNMQNQQQIPNPPMPGQVPPPVSFQETMQVQPEQDYAEPVTDERIEEIAEAIIDEKWTELIANVQKIVDWKDKTENKIIQLEQTFSDLKSSFDKLHSAVIEKIGQYDKNVSDIGTELKALEMVFQKLLPKFSENVNELGRIAGDLREVKK